MLVAVYFQFKKVLYWIRSSIHCSSTCIATAGCSAFYFDSENNVCQVGSNLKLISQESPSLPNDPMMAVSSLITAGTNRIKVISNNQSHHCQFNCSIFFNDLQNALKLTFFSSNFMTIYLNTYSMCLLLLLFLRFGFWCAPFGYIYSFSL